MSTRSNIGILNQDGTVDYIYCHFDGYLEHNGQILQEHYNTENRVKQLLALGDISVLGKNIGEKQDFNNRTKDSCLAYGRDRGETGGEVKKCSYVDYTKEYFEEYIYLFVPEKGWQVRENGIDYWADMSEALKHNII